MEVPIQLFNKLNLNSDSDSTTPSSDSPRTIVLKKKLIKHVRFNEIVDVYQYICDQQEKLFKSGKKVLKKVLHEIRPSNFLHKNTTYVAPEPPKLMNSFNAANNCPAKTYMTPPNRTFSTTSNPSNNFSYPTSTATTQYNQRRSSFSSSNPNLSHNQQQSNVNFGSSYTGYEAHRSNTFSSSNPTSQMQQRRQSDNFNSSYNGYNAFASQTCNTAARNGYNPRLSGTFIYQPPSNFNSSYQSQEQNFNSSYQTQQPCFNSSFSKSYQFRA
uniref:Uncharacterized protein n=1 Tax=Panagrolaimus sp. PS1159 TaxID=55785 RepID=A0AC35FF84_9BILA